jgi:endonuclease/exonuclease/phosphatase family metal-dependent hydrolase
MRFLIVTLLLICILNSLKAQSIQVMTYNIQFDNPLDGANAWPNRIHKVVAIIQKHKPDIIGVQEALHHQLQDLMRLLPEYSYVGVGRDDGKELGEYSAILYRHTRFGVLQNETLWLSETPDVPGSKSWDAALPRIVTIARFFDTETKAEFNILNTHFDHVGVEARLRSASYLAGMVAGIRIRTRDYPVLVTGDFNLEQTEESYTQLVGDELMDTRPVNDQTGTFCGFEVGKIECTTIDYVFHTKEWILKSYLVIKDNDGKYYPSDHFPVMAEFELAKEK